MENVRSKRRPVPQQDDVDIAIDKMKHVMKYNPIRQSWWKWVILFLVFFMLYSYLVPPLQSGGPAGLAEVLVQLAIQVGTSALFAIFFIYIQFFAIARPRAYWLKPYETGITFNDYKGNPQVLELAREIVVLLKGVKDSKDFQNMGGDVIRGLLLEGDPGVGKSYLAQAIATEAGLPFGYCSSPSLQSPILAGGMLSIRSLYGKARRLARQHGACILFLDEIDAIGQSRNGSNNGGGIGMGMGGMMGGGNMLINELLVQLDPPPIDDRMLTRFARWLGLDWRRKKNERPAVLTIGATNLVETLDAALIRPGRFDRKIRVDKPDAEGRREVIEYYLDKVNHENIPVHRFVDETINYSPVEIKTVINEAVIRAHFENRTAIVYKDLVQAREMQEVGIRQPIRGMSREDKRRLAYHETGHAVAQILLVPWERLVKLTIIRHGNALGFMQPKPLEEKHVLLKEELEVDIQVSLASRAAEELFLGSGSTGFSGDLANATRLAHLICARVGLNNHLSSADVLQAPPASYQHEIEDFLKDQMKKVKQLLEANTDLIHALAAELMERDELYGDEVMEIVNQFPIKLTSDAKKHRKPFGFHLGEDMLTEVGFGTKAWWEKESGIAAATGTDGIGRAGYGNKIASRPASLPAASLTDTVVTSVVTPPSNNTVEVTPVISNVVATPNVTEVPNAPQVIVVQPAQVEVASVQPIFTNPIITNQVASQVVTDITEVETLVNLPSNPPVTPIAPVLKPSTPMPPISNDEDDFLPRSW